MKSVCLIVIFTTISLNFRPFYAQVQENSESVTSLDKNRFSLELGIPFYGKASLNYSRFFVQKNRFKSALNWGIGRWYLPDYFLTKIDSGWNFSFTSLFVFGNKKKCFDMEFGAVLIRQDRNHHSFPDGKFTFQIFPDNFSEFNLMPAFNLGYRIEPANNKFMFRLNFGIPELIKLSLGRRF